MICSTKWKRMSLLFSQSVHASLFVCRLVFYFVFRFPVLSCKMVLGFCSARILDAPSRHTLKHALRKKSIPEFFERERGYTCSWLKFSRVSRDEISMEKMQTKECWVMFDRALSCVWPLTHFMCIYWQEFHATDYTWKDNTDPAWILGWVFFPDSFNDQNGWIEWEVEGSSVLPFRADEVSCSKKRIVETLDVVAYYSRVLLQLMTHDGGHRGRVSSIDSVDRRTCSVTWLIPKNQIYRSVCWRSYITR